MPQAIISSCRNRAVPFALSLFQPRVSYLDYPITRSELLAFLLRFRALGSKSCLIARTNEMPKPRAHTHVP